MRKKHSKAGADPEEKDLKHLFNANRPRRNRRDRLARAMAVIMIILMVGFSFITAGIFLLD